MAHIKIELNNGVIEEVSTAIIDKLYLNTLNSDNTSNLKGRLHVGVSYRALVEYLTLKYPELYISVDNYAIPFEDPKMLLYLTETMGLGTDGMITEAQAALAIAVANSANTEVTKFNELKYFTNVTLSKGGPSGTFSGYIRFGRWSSLEEVDLSNFTSIGHSNAYAYNDSFFNCTSLKTVTASSKLTFFGHRAFNGCSSLEEITGLEGIIDVYNYAFLNCTSLKSSTFENCEIHLYNSNGDGEFESCSSLIQLALINTNVISKNCFKNCSSLQYISGLSGDLTVKAYSFSGCTLLQDRTFTNVQIILDPSSGYQFQNCSSLTSITLADLDLTLNINNFKDCTNLTTINNSNRIKKFNGGDCFRGCSKLTSLDLSNVDFTDSNTKSTFESNDQYGRGMIFRECSQLTTIGITQLPVESLSYGIFWGCSSLTDEFVFTNQMNLTNGACFNGCSSLKKITFSHLVSMKNGNLHNINDVTNMFQNCTSLKVVDLGDSLTSLGSHNFSHCSALQAVIIRTTTPPQITSDVSNISELTLINMFGNSTVNVYVPDEAVDTYKLTNVFSNFADHILPLSNYNETAIMAS